MRQRASRAITWLWPIAVMGAIYFGSAQPDLGAHQGLLGQLLRKLFHSWEYALLALLTWRALRRTSTMSFKRAALVAIAVCVVYAATDEYHQTFVHGRSGEVSDVLIDGAGATIAMLCLAAARSRGMLRREEAGT